MHAQVDPHFTQYYVHPSWLNPALTGAFDGAYRASAIYRNQWSNVSSPFSTIGASLDFTTPKNLNLGVNLLGQRAGNGGYGYTTGYANAAYTGVRWGAMQQHRVVLALQAGLIQRKFNPSKLTFGDQWNPVTGGNTNVSAEVFGRTSYTTFDAGAGALYFDATPGKKANVFGGFSVSHLTQPADRFASNDGTAKVPVRYIIHAGVRLYMSETVALTPNALYLRQGNATETMLGAYAQLKATASTSLLLGANYRWKDAVAIQAGLNYDNMLISAAYDINTSGLGKMARGASSFEISLAFTAKQKVKTPEVEFVCPRL
ncbi:hypothetical protein FLA_3184 [Filimonas lacunae]|nr:hypothetical protein FLA_3184 [Filimonas lacunae]